MTDITAAITRIGATALADGDWVYRADETDTWYVVDQHDIELLAEMLADPEQYDAYSCWCAATDSREASDEQLGEIGVERR
jgi:hypothetical protein